MQSAADYLLRTESAVRMLFSGIDSYISILRKAACVTFVSGEPFGPKRDADFAVWEQENAESLATARAAEREFIAESFALDILCGSLLQVAEKALELYSSNNIVPLGMPDAIKQQHAKFCVGRPVRTVPLGLIIYAARNQHAHFDDYKLREPSATVFRLLATAHGFGEGQQIIDPAFNLENKSVLSFASNVTALLCWRSYERYSEDMRAMLAT